MTRTTRKNTGQDYNEDNNNNNIRQQQQQEHQDIHIPEQDEQQNRNNEFDMLLQDEFNHNEIEDEQEEAEQLLNEEEIQEATIIYCLNLPMVKTAVDNHHPNRNGDGAVALNERSQFCRQARTTALLTATYLLG